VVGNKYCSTLPITIIPWWKWRMSIVFSLFWKSIVLHAIQSLVGLSYLWRHAIDILNYGFDSFFDKLYLTRTTWIHELNNSLDKVKGIFYSACTAPQSRNPECARSSQHANVWGCSRRGVIAYYSLSVQKCYHLPVKPRSKNLKWVQQLDGSASQYYPT
jgi:hypothetical protein